MFKKSLIEEENIFAYLKKKGDFDANIYKGLHNLEILNPS